MHQAYEEAKEDMMTREDVDLIAEMKLYIVECLIFKVPGGKRVMKCLRPVLKYFLPMTPPKDPGEEQLAEFHDHDEEELELLQAIRRGSTMSMLPTASPKKSLKTTIMSNMPAIGLLGAHRNAKSLERSDSKWTLGGKRRDSAFSGDPAHRHHAKIKRMTIVQASLELGVPPNSPAARRAARSTERKEQAATNVRAKLEAVSQTERKEKAVSNVRDKLQAVSRVVGKTGRAVFPVNDTVSPTASRRDLKGLAAAMRNPARPASAGSRPGSAVSRPRSATSRSTRKVVLDPEVEAVLLAAAKRKVAVGCRPSSVKEDESGPVQQHFQMLRQIFAAEGIEARHLPVLANNHAELAMMGQRQLAKAISGEAAPLARLAERLELLDALAEHVGQGAVPAGGRQALILPPLPQGRVGGADLSAASAPTRIRNCDATPPKWRECSDEACGYQGYMVECERGAEPQDGGEAGNWYCCNCWGMQDWEQKQKQKKNRWKTKIAKVVTTTQANKASNIANVLEAAKKNREMGRDLIRKQIALQEVERQNNSSNQAKESTPGAKEPSEAKAAAKKDPLL
jgi:hypothetical protein